MSSEVPDLSPYEEQASQITGNAPLMLKQVLLYATHQRRKQQTAHVKGMKGYEPRIADRPVLTEVSINPKAEEPKKDEGRVVYEVTVEEDMLNAGRILHGACIGQLIDNCSTMPIFLMGLAKNGVPEMGVSQAINISYHSPALLGEKLRIVSTTTVMNKQALSANCEVWNVTSNRLVASGTHTKMVASTPRNGEPAKL